MKQWVSVLVFGTLVCHASGEEFVQSFKDGQFNEQALRVIGPAGQMSRNPDGLRITIKKDSGSSSNTGVSFPMQVVGDCAIESAVQVVDLPQPSGGYGTGAALLMEDGISQGASLQRVKMPNGKEHYIAHKFVRDSSGEYKHEAKTFPASGTDVALRMERRGGRLSYFVSEDQGAKFQKLVELPFTAEALKVAQVYCQVGGEPNTVEINIHNLRVEGEAFVRPGQKVPRRNAKVQWLVAVLFVAIPVIGGLIWWSRHRRA